MSAPDTNIDKQEKQHKPALLGVKGAMIFGIDRDLDPDGRIDMHEMAPDRHAALPR